MLDIAWALPFDEQSASSDRIPQEYDLPPRNGYGNSTAKHRQSWSRTTREQMGITSVKKIGSGQGYLSYDNQVRELG